ncbi:hypothetical protein [Streptomyces sp. NPDC059783]|uniref:hypothetical protein n=1 Tax=Streptomyces sp. NPDC059783 TaxID=3346944 RepID=UPI00366829B9
MSPRPRPGLPLWMVVLTGGIAVLVVLTPIAALSYAFSQMGKTHESTRSPSDDVTLSSCHRDPRTGAPVALARVENRGAGPGSYEVHVGFRDSAGKDGGRGVAAGMSTVVVREVAAGAVAERDMVGPAPVRGRPSCVILDAGFWPSKPAAHGPSFRSVEP